MRVRVQLGSVSSGTLRPEDLIPAFIDALDGIREQLAAPGSTTEAPAVLADRVRQSESLDYFLGDMEVRQRTSNYYEGEIAERDLDQLTDLLDAYAPPYCHFGAHPGDGADYGYWPDWEAIDAASQNGSVQGECTIYVAEPGEPWPIRLPSCVEYVLETGTNGAAVLYDRDGTEIWSV